MAKFAVGIYSKYLIQVFKDFAEPHYNVRDDRLFEIASVGRLLRVSIHVTYPTHIGAEQYGGLRSERLAQDFHIVRNRLGGGSGRGASRGRRGCSLYIR